VSATIKVDYFVYSPIIILFAYKAVKRFSGSRMRSMLIIYFIFLSFILSKSFLFGKLGILPGY